MVESFDVIIVGGGVIGLTIAHRLAGRGDAILLLERGACGAEASWAGAGILSPGHPHRLDVMVQFRRRSLDLYPDLCDALHNETGIDPEYRTCGELQLMYSNKSVDVAAGWTDGGNGGDEHALFQLLPPDEARVYEPRISDNIRAALWCPSAAQVRNPRLLKALKRAAGAAGADIREGEAVVDVLAEGTRLTGVRTERQQYAAGAVVLCAGTWTSQIGDRLAACMPVRPVRGQMVLLQEQEATLRRIVSRGKTYLVGRSDGHVLLGATEESNSGFEKRTTAHGVSGLIEVGLSLVPSIAEATVVASWAGLRPGTPDDKPYLGPVPGIEGLHAATGHFRLGLTLAPATAEYIASALDGRPYDVDLSSFRPGRTVAKG